MYSLQSFNKNVLFLERVLLLKEELQKKHQSLQSAYEQIYVEYNQALGKINNLQQQQQQHQTELPKQTVKKSLDSAVQTSTLAKVDKETEVTLDKIDKETKDIPAKDDKEIQVVLTEEQKSELTAEIEKVKEVLKNAPLETTDESVSLFVAVAKQYVEMKWKKDMLEHRLTEQSRELKETQELRESLQVDCEEMQTNIESLILQIQHLKSNLPSIPEASEERVASLETETESLQEEIRFLRDANTDMSGQLKVIKDAIKEQGTNIDLAKIDELLENKSLRARSQDSAEVPPAALEENMALRRRIDVLESELRVSAERCKGLDENIELIEELKMDMDNARRELKIALSNNKRLENSLAMLQEAKNEVDADNEALSREKEQLENDIKLLRESDSTRKDGEALAELREELKRTKEEKDDLEYDIRNMRNELDRSFEDLEEHKVQNEKLSGENERLVKENNKLTDQFSETQNESMDKIELLNTEMTLLQQELEGCKEELENSMRKMSEMEERILTLENENKQLNETAMKVNDVEGENQRLKSQLEEIAMQKSADSVKAELDIALSKLRELEEKVLIVENENKKLQSKLLETGNVSSENEKLLEEIEEKRKQILKNEEEMSNIMTKMKYTENYISTLKNENSLLESKVTQLEALQREKEKYTKEIEELHQQELERRQKEIENSVQKEWNVKYQNEIEKLRTLESENQKLKVELDKLLVAKRDAEVNTENLTINENSYEKTPLSEDERTQLINQVTDKSKEIETLKATIAKDKESALMARETVENLSQLISSKDNDLIKMNSSFDTLKNEKDELIKLVQEKHNESLQYHSEIQRLTQLISDQTNNLQKIIAERDANSAALQDKEAQLLWAQNELQVIKQRLTNIEETNNHGEKCGIAEHTLLAKQASALEEKNKAMEAVILQNQSNIRYLQEQLMETQSKEASTVREIERLRSHLVEIETSHNEEALQSEEIQRTLEARLMQAEEKLKNSSSMYTSVSVRANQQVETLQQQLALIMQQRDDLQNKISAAEDKVLSYTASLTNLQLVLEQFQRGK